MRKSIKMIAVTGAAVLGIATVGVGWAYFTENATATASGGAGAQMQPVNIVGTPQYDFDVPQGLYPGHNADVRITVSNPNDVAVTIDSVVPAATGAKTVTGGTTPDDGGTRIYCTDRIDLNATPAVTKVGGGELVIPAAGQVELLLTDAVALQASADNRCQGMQFSTAWTVAVRNN